MKKKNWIKYGFLWLLAGAAMITIMGLAAMYLWNWLIPTLFSGPSVTFIEALGLIILGKLLTGFGGGMGGRKWKHRGYGRDGWCCGDEHSGYWKKRWQEKMEHMTPEERERFKKYYYERCGWKREHVEEKDQTTENSAG